MPMTVLSGRLRAATGEDKWGLVDELGGCLAGGGVTCLE